MPNQTLKRNKRGGLFGNLRKKWKEEAILNERINQNVSNFSNDNRCLSMGAYLRWSQCAQNKYFKSKECRNLHFNIGSTPRICVLEDTELAKFKEYVENLTQKFPELLLQSMKNIIETGRTMTQEQINFSLEKVENKKAHILNPKTFYLYIGTSNTKENVKAKIIYRFSNLPQNSPGGFFGLNQEEIDALKDEVINVKNRKRYFIIPSNLSLYEENQYYTILYSYFDAQEQIENNTEFISRFHELYETVKHNVHDKPQTESQGGTHRRKSWRASFHQSRRRRNSKKRNSHRRR